MARTPACITPAAGKFEDQQLATSWQYIEKRCRLAGFHVSTPSRHDAVRECGREPWDGALRSTQ